MLLTVNGDNRTLTLRKIFTKSVVAVAYGFLVVVIDVLCINDRSSIGNVLPIEKVVNYGH